MKKLFFLIVFFCLPAAAQFIPPPGAAFTYSSGSWVAASSTATAGAISYTPPPVALYCYNSGTSQWVPATSACFGGGTGGISLTTTGTSGAATLTGTVLNIPVYSSGSSITLTTTGTSGAATLTGSVLNIPVYSSGGGSGTVNSGTSGQLAYYAATGTAVSGLGVGTGLTISGGNLNVTGSSLPTGTAYQTPEYLAAGTTVTPVSNGLDLDATSGAIIDSYGARSTLAGLQLFGDSKTAGTGGGCGTTATLNLCFPYRLNGDINQGKFNNYALAGNDCADVAYGVAKYSNPGDYYDPVVVADCGTNDVGLHTSGWPTGSQAQLDQSIYAILTTAGLSSTAKITAANMTQTSGTWTADTTFTANPGLVTTGNGVLTNTSCEVGATGVLGMHFYQYGTSSSTYSVALTDIGSGALTDQITQTSAISAQYISSFAPVNIGTTTEAAARFIYEADNATPIPPGLHTCTVTVASTGGSAGVVDFFSPPAARSSGTTSPIIAFSNTSPEQNNGNQSLITTLNTWVAGIVSTAYVDGVAAKMTNMFAHIDPHGDLGTTATTQCPLPGVTTLHWNQCGQVHAAQAVEEALKISPSTQPNINSAAQTINNGMLMNPQTSLGSTTTLGYTQTWYSNSSNLNLFDMFGSLANTANSGVGFAASSYAHMHVGGFLGTNSYDAFCYDATFPVTAINQVTCGNAVGGSVYSFTSLATIAAIVSQSRSPAPFLLRSSGWNTGGTAAANDDTQIYKAWTSNGSAGNQQHGFKHSASSGTGTDAFCDLNGSSFGFCYTTSNSTVLSTGAPGFGLSIPFGTATFAVGSGVTSVACASGYACNNSRGTLTIVGGTATTGTIATVTFSAALAAAPQCFVTQNGGTSLYAVGNGAPTTTAFTVTAGITVAGATLTVGYQCVP